MFKFFGVSKDNDFEEIEVDVDDEMEMELEPEVGQVAVDILETPYEMIVLAPIAGITIEDIDLGFNENILTIRGERKRPDIYSQDVKIRNSECFWGRFVRNIILPENLDFENIKASIENNLLVVTISKLQFATQKIEIDEI